MGTVTGFDRARRSMQERLDAAEGRIAGLEALGACQQRTIELLAEAVQSWVNSGGIFKTLADEMRQTDQRVTALEVKNSEMRLRAQ